MTARELIEAVKLAGGTLSVEGEKLCCTLPRDSAHLLTELRSQEAAVVEILRRRSSGVPWPGYHNNQPFTCQKCGRQFDTSAGYAKHLVYVCC